MLVARAALASALLVAASLPGLAFEVSSPSVSDNDWDKKFIADAAAGCDGQNVSPTLVWSGVPPEAKSLAVTMYDPDAPSGSGWWHWQVWNIPATATGLEEGKLPAGAVAGKGDLGRPGYLGPCPPPGSGVHHYVITLYALKVDKLDIDPAAASGAMVGFNLNGNAIAKATATYTLEK